MSIPKIFAWCQIPSAEIVFIFSSIDGVDAVVLDFEHGCISASHIFNAKSAASRNNKALWARIPSNGIHMVSNMVDMGIDGIILANVEDPEQVSTLIERVSYPPIGHRGIGFSASNHFGGTLEANLSKEERFPVIVMVESRLAIENLSEICSVGPAGVMIGPYDLSCSLGDIGNFESKEFKEVVKKVRLVCKTFNVPFGGHVVSSQPLDFLGKSVGYDFCAASMDVQVLRDGMVNLVAVKK